MDYRGDDYYNQGGNYRGSSSRGVAVAAAVEDTLAEEVEEVDTEVNS